MSGKDATLRKGHNPEEATASAKLRQLKPLIEEFRAQQAKSYETLEEIMQIISGDVSTHEQLTRLQKAWQEVWSTRYRSRFDWKHTIDTPQAKRLLKLLTLEELEARMLRYIKNDDPFFRKVGHNFLIFARDINQFAVESTEFTLRDSEAPIGCTHTPLCKTDTEHTQRLNAERRNIPF
jgi:hypothetical protein